jgi:hypothetical protein
MTEELGAWVLHRRAERSMLDRADRLMPSWPLSLDMLIRE